MSDLVRYTNNADLLKWWWQKKKEEEKAKDKELNDLFKIAVSQPKVPVGNIISVSLWVCLCITIRCCRELICEWFEQVLILSPYCVSFSKWGSVPRASSASSPTIWMFRGKGKRLTFIVISVTRVFNYSSRVTNDNRLLACCFGFHGFLLF